MTGLRALLLHSFIRFLWLVLVVSLLAGCGGGGGGGGAGVPPAGSGRITPPVVTPPPTGTLRLQLPLERAVPAAIEQLRITLFDVQGRVVFGPVVRPKAPVIDLDDVPVSGVTLQIDFLEGARVAGTGTRSVTINQGQKTTIENFDFSDVPVVLQEIVVSPSSSLVPLGVEQQLTALGRYDDGSRRDLTSLVQWSLLDSTVASLSSQGVLEPLAVGSTTVRASFGPLIGETEVIVTEAVLESLVVQPPSLSLPQGLSSEVEVSGVYSDGSTLPLDDQVDWTSANAQVVAWDGRVYTNGVGQTQLTASFQGREVQLPVNVGPAQAVDLRIAPLERTIAAGTSTSFEAIVTFTDGLQRDVTDDVAWTTSDSEVATISQEGVATSYVEGETYVQASFTAESYPTVTASEATLTVTSAEISSIQITPREATLTRGTEAQYTALATFTDGTRQDITGEANWNTGDATIADISFDGLLSAVEPGETTVSVSRQGVTAETSVTVTQATPVSLTLSPTSATLPEGLEQQFTLEATLNNNTRQDVTDSALWSSSDDSIASVDASGLVSFLQVGTAEITAEIAGLTKTATVTVNEAELVSLEVSPEGATVVDGLFRRFTATGRYTDGAVREVTNKVGWRSSDPSIANIDLEGRAQGISEGLVRITATSGSVSAFVDLEVTPAEVVELLVTPQELSLPLGLTHRYSAEAVLTDGRQVDVSEGVVWSSLDEVVASMALDGLLKAESLGQTSVVATLGVHTVSTSVTVVEPVLVAVDISPQDFVLGRGSFFYYDAYGRFSNGSVLEVTNQAIWSVSDEEIATVESNGKLTAGIAGEAIVSADYQDMRGTALVRVVEADQMPLDQVVNLTRIGEQTLPSMDMATHATWDSEIGGNHEVRARFLPTSVEITVSENPSNSLTYPDIAVALDREFVVVWEAPDSAGQGVFYRLFDASRQPITEVRQASPDSADSQYRPRVTSVGDGFAIVWEVADGSGETSLGGALLAADGTVIRNDLEPAAGVVGSQCLVEIDSARDGKYSICWESNDGESWSVLLRSYEGHVALGPAELVNNSVEYERTEPSMASGTDGRTAVSWTHQAGELSSQILYRIYHSETGLGSVAPVTEIVGGPQSNSSITFRPREIGTGSKISVAFEAPDAFGSGIFVDRESFYGTGSLTNRLNISQEGDQAKPSFQSVFDSPNPNFERLGWVFEGADGSGRGILGRLTGIGYVYVSAPD